ncbi:MAG: hypothetical protein ACJAR1_001721 [Rubritalea sp.]|jgi:hypothetical protein
MNRFLLLPFFALNSCSNSLIETAASSNKSSVQQNGEVSVTLHAKNTTRKAINVPHVFYEGKTTTMSFSGVYFKPSKRSSDFAITRDSYVCSHGGKPDFMQPGEAREYYFYWSPCNSSEGKGDLFVNVPFEFAKPNSIPIIITK